MCFVFISHLHVLTAVLILFVANGTADRGAGSAGEGKRGEICAERRREGSAAASAGTSSVQSEVVSPVS